MVVESDGLQECAWRGRYAACNHEYLVPVIDKTIREYWEEIGKPETLRIFDAGCGNGYLAGHFLTCGFEAAGCDSSESGIDNARASYPSGRFEVLSVYEDMAGVFGKDWEIVVSSEVIEHHCNPRGFVRRAAELLKPGGLLIVTTPYHGYVKNLALAAAGAFDHHFSALWDGGHIKFWSYKTLKMLLAEQGFVRPVFNSAGRLPWLWKSMVVSIRKPHQVDSGSGVEE